MPTQSTPVMGHGPFGNTHKIDKRRSKRGYHPRGRHRHRRVEWCDQHGLLTRGWLSVVDWWLRRYIILWSSVSPIHNLIFSSCFIQIARSLWWYGIVATNRMRIRQRGRRCHTWTLVCELVGYPSFTVCTFTGNYSWMVHIVALISGANCSNYIGHEDTFTEYDEIAIPVGECVQQFTGSKVFYCDENTWGYTHYNGDGLLLFMFLLPHTLSVCCVCVWLGVVWCTDCTGDIASSLSDEFDVDGCDYFSEYTHCMLYTLVVVMCCAVVVSQCVLQC